MIMAAVRLTTLTVCGFILAVLGLPLAAAERPNVLVIMVDDLGFSDLGCYGSEIETPTLDALAANGLRFSQFYNTAKCHSSRVSLLTGQYCIAAGDTSLSHAVTSAEVLRDAGYFTAMTGKWHLKQEPTDFGFDRYFGHLSGACNYFKGDGTFRLNGKPWKVPSEGFYTTVADVDYGLKFLDQAKGSAKPWFLYVAFNAPHAPLQALPQDYEKYEGRYDSGWDAIRERRVQRQRDLDLLPSGFEASPRPDHIPAWESLSEPRQAFETKRMTTLAAMIDRVDQEIGRLVAHLKSTGQLDSTLIWFVSDNGACPYDRVSRGIDREPTSGDVSLSDSTGWAWARNTPFRFYKQNQFEGGIGTPAIVHWPEGLSVEGGSICREPAHLIDILPTIAEATGAAIPIQHDARELRPISGQSLMPVFEGRQLRREQPLHFLFSEDRGLRDGDWKLVSFRRGPWELYNLREDRTELNDLAQAEPRRLQAMIDKWREMAGEVLHATGRTVAPVKSEPVETHPEWTDFSSDPVDGVRASAKKQMTRGKREPKAGTSIRARKNTRLERRGDRLQLTFTGDDPGIAVDHLPGGLFNGPYELSFELASESTGVGEVFFTIDAATSLPRGNRQAFSIKHDGQWHPYSIPIATEKQIRKLRLDVADSEGTAQIRGLRICGSSGDVLSLIPEATSGKR